MLYFNNTSEEMQRLAMYAAKSFQLLGASPQAPLTGGFSPGPRWGTSPRPRHTAAVPAIFPRT